MQETNTDRMPTGITSLDPILEGGVPPGSVILLLGDTGGGNYEFAYSSLIHLLQLGKGNERKGMILPQEIQYITFTRLQEDVKGEILHSFQIEGLEEMLSGVRFRDLSEQYFDASIVPDDWYSHSDIKSRLEKRSGHESTLLQLSSLISETKDSSLIVLDSVTDLISQSSTPALWQNLAGFLRGLQRISKQKKLTTYLLLSRGILDPAREREIAEIVDAVMLFKWEETTGARRQRVMYFEKFRGVMTHLEERDLVKFAVRITPAGGFEVSNIRMII
jgi:KaiC/GvpD/RAD55 family RecA-like ATPase